MSVVEAACVELVSVSADVGVGATLIPVVCSWALAIDEMLASRRQTAACCLFRPFAISCAVLDLASSVAMCPDGFLCCCQ